MLLGLLAATAAAQDSRDLLDSERWTDRRYGISLLPPIGAKLLGTTGDDYIVRILDQQARYQMTVGVKQSRSDLSLAEVADAAVDQVTERNANEANRLLDRKSVEVGPRRAVQLFYAIGQPSTADALLGQTILQVDSQRFVIVEVNSAAKHAEYALTAYNAVVQTVEIADQQALARQRRDAIELTETWREGLTEAKLREAVGRKAVYRIVDDRRRDIGWMRLSSGTGEFAGLPGIQVVVETRLEVDRYTVNTKADYFRPFESPEGEAWSVRSSVSRQTDRGPQSKVAVETGSATIGTVEIKLDSTDGTREDLTFPRPPKGYLPQVDGHLLPWLLPRDTPGEFGFYWYNANEKQMTFRLERVTPTLTGHVVTSRLSPNGAELRASYDRDGRLIEKDLGGGRKLLPTSAAELKAIWGKR